MHAMNAKLKSTTWQLMAITFLGIHVPMVGLILHGLVNSFAGMMWILLTVLVATMVSTGVSLLLVYKIMSAVGAQEPNRAGVAQAA